MTDYELSRSWGKHGNYLAEVKCTNRKMYDHLKKVGLPKHRQRIEDVKNAIGEMFHELLEKRAASRFYNECLTDLYVNKYSFHRTMDVVAFRQIESILPVHKVEKYEEVLRRYERWKR